jgi:hypothetical protein
MIDPGWEKGTGGGIREGRHRYSAGRRTRRVNGAPSVRGCVVGADQDGAGRFNQDTACKSARVRRRRARSEVARLDRDDLPRHTLTTLTTRSQGGEELHTHLG